MDSIRLSIKTLSPIGPRLKQLLDCLANQDFTLVAAEFVAQRKVRVSPSALVAEVLQRDRGLANISLEHPSVGSVGGVFEWLGEDGRTREQAFDEFSFAFRPSDGDRDLLDSLPELLGNVAESVEATYGLVAPNRLSYQRHLKTKVRETLLHGLPPLLPVGWLSNDLVDYVGSGNWARGGVSVIRKKKGALVIVPHWLEANAEVLDDVQQRVGKEYFFHGLDWTDYPPSPLERVAKRLPSARIDRPE